MLLGDYPIQENLRNDTLAVGTSSVLVSPQRKRKEIVITNTSTAAQNITLTFGKTAVAGKGVFLLPYSVWYSSQTEGFNVTNDEIYAISSAVAGQLSIFER